jgi:hypothetical protein
VRLRFFRSADGSVYEQTKQGKPKLPLIPKETQQPLIDQLNSAIDDIPLAPAGSTVPVRTPTIGSRYQRDDKVRQFIIAQAKSVCEYCGELGFLLPDGNHYLEAHHIIALEHFQLLRSQLKQLFSLYFQGVLESGTATVLIKPL